MPRYVFYDFVDADGVNQIERWLTSEVPSTHRNAVRSRLRARIEAQQLKATFSLPEFRDLHGQCDGLFEFRFMVKQVPYRPLACHGLRRGEVVILFGAKEHSDSFVPLNACRQALARRELIFGVNGRRHLTLHDYTQSA